MKQISPDDPRLTALALGELAEAEAREIETALAGSPEARVRLAELRLLASELGEAFAAETAEQAAAEPPREPAPVREGKRALDGTFAGEPTDGGRPRQRRRGPATGWLGRFLDTPSWAPSLLRYGPAAIVACLMLAVVFIPTVGRVREASGRVVWSSNLREITQAYLIAMNELEGKPFPKVADVREFAAELARLGGANEARLWVTDVELSAAGMGSPEFTILDRVRGERSTAAMNPEFGRMPLSVAVALPPPGCDAPSTTPVAWTRGLRSDGTWAPDSPFGGDGGFVAYMGGNVSWTRSGSNNFLRLEDGKPTSDIREALPPGSHISEWSPDAAHSQRLRTFLHLRSLLAQVKEPFPVGVALGASALVALVLFLLLRRRGPLTMVMLGFVLLFAGWILLNVLS